MITAPTLTFADQTDEVAVQRAVDCFNRSDLPTDVESHIEEILTILSNLDRYLEAGGHQEQTGALDLD